MTVAKSVLSLLAILLYGAACAQSDSSKREHNTNTMTNEQGTPVVYTALGDSTGVGTGAKEGGGYVARIFKRLKNERPLSRLTNLCVSGATAENVIRGQLREAINSRPTLITLGIGINDIGHGMSAELFSRNFEQIIKQLTEGTRAKIVVTNIPDISFAPVIFQSERERTRRTVQLFNEKIRAIAGRYHVAIVDAYTETHNVIPTHPEFFSEDGFHPSDAGYEYWATTMWPTVNAEINAP